MSKKGFTLIELLVVIAIIALLLAILLPALNKVKMQAKTVICSVNCKSLSTAWNTYAMENGDMIVSSWTGYAGYGQQLVIPASEDAMVCRNPWIGWAGYQSASDTIQENERQITAIKQGKLYPYVETTKVYRCPASRKYEIIGFTIPEIMGFPTTQPPHECFEDTTVVLKMSQIKSPGSRIAFLDEGEPTYRGYSLYYDRPQWWDVPPVRHDNGITLGYADGHAEFYKWRDKRTIELGKSKDDETIPQNFTHSNPVSTDLIMMQTRTYGKLGYQPN